MNKRLSLVGVLLLILTALVALALPASGPVAAAPAFNLDVASLSLNDSHCLFAADCDPTVSQTIGNFSLDGADIPGTVASHLWPRGAADLAGAGLYPYLYRIDLSEAAATGPASCVTGLQLPFGPAVPLDYDGDNSLEYAFVVSSGGEGTIAPDSVEQMGNLVILTFAPGLCAGAGDSSLYLGLASPFAPHADEALVADNEDGQHAVDVQVPDAQLAPYLSVTPTSARGGETVQLVGSGFTPGGYTGTIRWNGTDTATFDIPEGGAFAESFTLPAGASPGPGTITVCSLAPCATGEFEQLADAPFELLPTLYRLLLPAVQAALGSPVPFGYSIDGSVEPFRDSLPGLEGGPPRPLAALLSPQGYVTTFVANELVLQTDNQAELDSFLARTGGELLLTVDPADAGLLLPALYLVRVDLSEADLADFIADVNLLLDEQIQSPGQFVFSGDDAVRLFDLAAQEAAAGLDVAVNWVGETGAVPFDSDEAPAGTDLGGVPYTPDAYQWVHMAQGTTQDIGVPEAWDLLHNAGRLGNRVQVAVLDGGFYPNPDFPAFTTFLNIFPFDPRNVDGIDGSSPFHGTHVLQTVAALSDDDFGIVGVGAPVVDPVAVYTSYDYMVSIGSVLLARASGARIMNMSYSAQVPAVFGWTVLPFEMTTAALRASGALLFASAGNDGTNVDGEDCFIICWEHTWITPCENAGVYCVGGLGWNSKNRAGNSNFGAEHVDIYAPYTVYAGQAPDRPGAGATAGSINGTSFSSPYAASVAALIWAGDPSLSAGQVWDIMVATAHSSPDPRVNRYVNAYNAVLRAIGIGLEGSIGSPANGATVQLNQYLTMDSRIGYVAEADGIPVTVEWRSQPGNRLLNSRTYTPGAGSHTIYSTVRNNSLPVGTHTITLRVTAGAAQIEDSVTITVVNSPPTANITDPASGLSFCPGSTITFRGAATDPNEPSGLPGSAFSWRSNVDGSLGSGNPLLESGLSEGSHTITLRVTDPQGLFDEDSITVTIKSASDPTCTDRDPTASITAPASGSSYYVDEFDGTNWYKEITFQGVVDDYEDPTSALTVSWDSDKPWSPGTVSTNPTTGVTTVTARLYNAPGESYTTHTITLTVTDTDGHTISDDIEVIIQTLIR